MHAWGGGHACLGGSHAQRGNLWLGEVCIAEGCACPGWGACVAGGHVWQGGMHALGGMCAWGDVCGRGACMASGGWGCMAGGLHAMHAPPRHDTTSTHPTGMHCCCLKFLWILLTPRSCDIKFAPKVTSPRTQNCENFTTFNLNNIRLAHFWHSKCRKNVTFDFEFWSSSSRLWGWVEVRTKVLNDYTVHIHQQRWNGLPSNAPSNTSNHSLSGNTYHFHYSSN